MKRLLFFVFLTLSLQACSNDSGMNSYEKATETAPAVAGYAEESAISTADDGINQPENTSSEIPIEQKLIKEAFVDIEVDNFEEAREALEALVEENKGYISNENQSKSSYYISSTITIRIPKEQFDAFVEQIETIAHEVQSKNIMLTDVTEEYIDVKKRLENKRQVEQRYLELLKDANTINEILAVEEHIRVLREEIEAKEGRLNYLNNRIGLSTITLTIYEYEEQIYSGFSDEMLQAFENGWKGILNTIIGLITIWPLLLLIAGGVYLFIRYRRKRKRKKETGV